MVKKIINIKNFEDLFLVKTRYSDIKVTTFTSFFTIWMLLIQCLYYLGPLQKYQFSILILSFIVSFIGFNLVYKDPKYLYVEDTNIKYSGKIIKMFDLLAHQIPLFIFILNYNTSIKRDNCVFLLLVLIIYLALNNPFKVYRFMSKYNTI